MTTRVLIADDQDLIRAGLRMILDAEASIDVVAEATNGREAVEQARLFHPDVVLMDIRMPELDGLAATRLLLETPGTTARVLILTTFDLDEYVYEALRAGASGFLLKDSSARAARRRHRHRRPRRGSPRPLRHPPRGRGIRAEAARPPRPTRRRSSS